MIGRDGELDPAGQLPAGGRAVRADRARSTAGSSRRPSRSRRAGDRVEVNLSAASIGDLDLLRVHRDARCSDAGADPADSRLRDHRDRADARHRGRRGVRRGPRATRLRPRARRLRHRLRQLHLPQGLPINYLKIDIEFVRDLTDNPPTGTSCGRSSAWPATSACRRSPKASRTPRRSTLLEGPAAWTSPRATSSAARRRCRPPSSQGCRRAPAPDEALDRDMGTAGFEPATSRV